MCGDKTCEIERVRHTKKEIEKTGDIEKFLCKARDGQTS